MGVAEVRNSRAAIVQDLQTIIGSRGEARRDSLPAISNLERVIAPPSGVPGSVTAIKGLIQEATQDLDPVDSETIDILLGLREETRPNNKTRRLERALNLRRE